MPCFRPLQGWRSSTVNPSGKRSIVFTNKEAFRDMPLDLPCGQCIGCRLERSRQWAMRCMHEASLYEHNAFITLTYDQDNLPPSGSLIKRDFQLFMKKFRKELDDDAIELSKKLGIQVTADKIRYFHCGEYGENLGRPHYHACIFNYDFPDKKLWKKQESGDLYVSEKLNNIWGKGYCIVGAVTFDSAAYVARYICKKITGASSGDHYSGKLPEYTTMSRRPGIGKGWYDKFRTDCYPSDSVIVNGKEFRPPKFYDKKYELDFPSEFNKVKQKRLAMALEPWDNENSTSRMIVKEKVQALNLSALNRSYEK